MWRISAFGSADESNQTSRSGDGIALVQLAGRNVPDLLVGAQSPHRKELGEGLVERGSRSGRRGRGVENPVWSELRFARQLLELEGRRFLVRPEHLVLERIRVDRIVSTEAGHGICRRVVLELDREVARPLRNLERLIRGPVVIRDRTGVVAPRDGVHRVIGGIA